MAKNKAKGVILKYGDAATPTNTIPQLAEISFDGGAWDRVDITTHDTSGVTKAYDVVQKEPPSIEVRLMLDPADTAHAWLITSHAAATLRYITFVLPDAGAAEWACSGHITNLQVSGLLVGGYIEASFTFACNAAATFTA